jgi:hypothetical protein
MPIACKVDWPQEPNSVLIENSNFHENPDGGFNLHMRFKISSATLSLRHG